MFLPSGERRPSWSNVRHSRLVMRARAPGGEARRRSSWGLPGSESSVTVATTTQMWVVLHVADSACEPMDGRLIRDMKSRKHDLVEL